MKSSIKNSITQKVKIFSNITKKSNFDIMMTIVVCVLISMFVFNSKILSAANIKEAMQVSILQIVDHPALNKTRQGIVDELKTVAIIPKYEIAQGNPGLATQIAQKFVGESPNIVVGIGTTATQALISSNRKQIPIVFSSVTDPLAAYIVQDLKKPGKNISGVSNFVDSTPQFSIFKKIMPNLKRLGVIYNPGESNSVSLINNMMKEAFPFKINILTASANNTMEALDATLSLLKQVDAIFINNDNTALSAFDGIIKIAQKNNIPVFVSDTDMLEKGALAALGPDQYQIGRQTGKMIIDILKNGQFPGELSVQFPEKVEFHVNLKAARALKIDIPNEILKEAIVKLE